MHEPGDDGNDIWGRPREPIEEEPLRGYDPIHPGTDWRKRLSRITGPIAAIGLTLLKFSFLAL